MNSCIFIGNLTKDPELRYTKDNTAVASFTIAVNRIKDGVDFIPIKVFGKQAESCNKYLIKGKKVAVEGEYRTNSFEKDSKKYYNTEIMANKVHFLSNSTNTQENKKLSENVPENRSESALSEQAFADFGDSIEINDEDLAF